MEGMQEVGVHAKRVSLELLGRGVLAMLFALGALAAPRMTIRELALLFAIYAVADGALSFFGAAQLRRRNNRKVGGIFAAEGVLSVALAIVAFVVPGVLLLRILGGARAIVVGASDALWAHRAHGRIAVEVSGWASIILGVLAVVWPGPGTVALPWLIALPPLASGALLITGAFGDLEAAESPRSA